MVDEVRSRQLDACARYDIGEKHDGFRDGGTDEIEGGGEDDDVEDVIDEACLHTNRHQ